MTSSSNNRLSDFFPSKGDEKPVVVGKTSDNFQFGFEIVEEKCRTSSVSTQRKKKKSKRRGRRKKEAIREVDKDIVEDDGDRREEELGDERPASFESSLGSKPNSLLNINLKASSEMNENKSNNISKDECSYFESTHHSEGPEIVESTSNTIANVTSGMNFISQTDATEHTSNGIREKTLNTDEFTDLESKKLSKNSKIINQISANKKNAALSMRRRPKQSKSSKEKTKKKKEKIEEVSFITDDRKKCNFGLINRSALEARKAIRRPQETIDSDKDTTITSNNNVFSFGFDIQF